MYEDALTRDPTNQSIMGDFALFLAEIEQHSHAIKMFENSVAPPSRDVSRVVNFASFLSDREMWSEAQEWYERAEAIDWHDAPLHFNLGCFHAKQGHLLEAIDALQTAVLVLAMDDPDFDDSDLDRLRGNSEFEELIFTHQCIDTD